MRGWDGPRLRPARIAASPSTNELARRRSRGYGGGGSGDGGAGLYGLDRLGTLLVQLHGVLLKRLALALCGRGQPGKRSRATPPARGRPATTGRHGRCCRSAAASPMMMTATNDGEMKRSRNRRKPPAPPPFPLLPIHNPPRTPPTQGTAAAAGYLRLRGSGTCGPRAGGGSCRSGRCRSCSRQRCAGQRPCRTRTST
jgi:hypothetical protein